jgi:IQ and AAA domain-containing protein
MGDPKRI